MTDDERFKRWDQWIRDIHRAVEDAIINRTIRHEVSKIIEANPRIQRPSAFYEWMAAISSDSELMAVRRQLDKDSRSTSLWRLLTDMIDPPEITHREFGKRVGSSAHDADQATIQTDFDNLIKKTEDVERYATKRVAHFDEEEPKNTLTFQELDDALDLIHELRVKYLFLLCGATYQGPPVWTDDWKAIFREPWIR